MADGQMTQEQINKVIVDATEGLKAKNKELLKEVKDAKATLSKFDGVNLEELTNAQTELNKLKKKKDESEGNYKKLYESQQEQHQLEVKKLQDVANADKKSLYKERTTNALTRALAEHHVDPVLIEPASTLLSNNVAVNDDGVPMVGDKDVGAFVKEWTAGDVGKRFVTNANSGGGASGPGGKQDAQSSFYDPNSPKYNLTEQGRIATANPDLHKSLKASAPQKRTQKL